MSSFCGEGTNVAPKLTRVGWRKTAPVWMAMVPPADSGRDIVLYQVVHPISARPSRLVPVYAPMNKPGVSSESCRMPSAGAVNDHQAVFEPDDAQLGSGSPGSVVARVRSVFPPVGSLPRSSRSA